MKIRTSEYQYICLITILLTCSLISVKADVFGDYSYITNNSGQATITGYSGTETMLSVPATLGTIPVVAIGQSAFYGKNLQYIHLPDSVVDIGPNAFQWCDQLNEAQIGTGVTNIEYHAFWGCAKMQFFTVATGNPAYSDVGGVLFNADQTTFIQCPQGKKGNYTLPSTVRIIGDQAFAGCSALTNVDLPNGLLAIENQAFYTCTALTNVVIPDSVTNTLPQCYLGCSGLLSASIGNGVPMLDGTFTDCPYLANVTLGNSITNLTQTFIRCYQLRNIALPAGLKTIGDMAFAGSGIYSIGIHSNITSIGSSAFSGCHSLMNASLTNGLFSIERNAFQWCDVLQDINIPDTVTNLGTTAFEFCQNAKRIHIGEGITNITDDAFYACNSATNIEWGTHVANIDSYAFDGCTNLTSVQLPNSVITLGNYAFCGCTRLVSIQLNNNLTSIGEYAFEWDSWMPSIYIPASVTNIGILAWEQCYSLGSINVDPANQYYSTRNGILYDKAGTTLLQYPAGLYGTAVIPDGTTKIALDAFEYCTGVTNVVLPNTLTSIGDSAFDTCKNLTGVTIPASVTNLGYYAFNYCDKLKAILFEGNAPTVWNYTFGMQSLGPTIYYLPETSGWESGILGNRTTTLWNPNIAADGNMGIQNGQFGFNITGNTNLTVVIEAATSLQNPVWVPVSTNSLQTGSSQFTDAEPADQQTKFYRIRRPL